MHNLLTRAANWWINREYEASAKALAPELLELGLRRVQPTPDGAGWEATFITPAAALIANEMAAMLDAAQAENYLTFDFLPRLDRGKKPVRVTVQWARGQNPAQMVTTLKARVADLEAQLEARDADPT